MAFKEESLEDKIAAIMSGNYNFGPPIKAPSVSTAAPGPIAASFSAAAQSLAPPMKPIEPSMPWTESGHSFQESNSSNKTSSKSSSPIPEPEEPPNLANESSSEKLNQQKQQSSPVSPPPERKQNSPLIDAEDKPVARSSPPIITKAPTISTRGTDNEVVGEQTDLEAPLTSDSRVSNLSRTMSALVGFGEVYEDATSNVVYDQDDLHRDAVADGYDGLLETEQSVSVRFGDVYSEDDEVDYEKKSDGSVSRRVSIVSGSGEAVDRLTEEIPAKSASSSTSPASASQTISSTGLMQPILNDKEGNNADEDDSPKVQPQLDFIPLSQRSSSQGLSALEGNGLSTATEDGASGSRSAVMRAGMESPYRVEKPLGKPIAAAAVAPSAMRAASLQSLLLGENEEDEENVNVSGDATIDHEPAGVDVADTNIDDDSLNGTEEEPDPQDEYQQEQELSEDLMQTVRTTVHTDPAVVEQPIPSVATRTTRAEPAPVPLPTLTMVSAPPAPAVKQKPAENHSVNNAPASEEEGGGEVEESAGAMNHAKAGIFPGKPRSTTPSSLAREKAAFLLPTISEEKPSAAVVHPPKPSHPKPPQNQHQQASKAPLKFTADASDTTDHSHFLARISAATSVPIDVPPPMHRERSTTPTSIPKPSSNRARSSSAGSTSSTDRGRAAAPSASSSPPEPATHAHKTVQKTIAGRGRKEESDTVVAAPKRAVSPAALKKSTNSPSATAKKAAPVLMSTTSADEIALASSGGNQSKASQEKKTGSLKGGKGATLLNISPPRKERGVTSASSTSAPAPAAAPLSGKKAKAPSSWIITAAQAAQANERETAAAAAPISAPTSAAKKGKAAAWVIENESSPLKLLSPTRSPVGAGAGAGEKSNNNKARTPVTPSTNRSVVNSLATSFAPVNASASISASLAPTTPNTSEASRSRAVSPNTTAKSVSRIAHATPQLALYPDDNPHPERAVKVAVRVRPFTAAELQQGHRRTVSMNAGRMVIVNPKSFEQEPDAVASVAVATDNRQWAHLFEFDNILWNYDPQMRKETHVNQIELHRSLGLDIVENALQGISSSCFAYGHTCTGKTYSLFGPSMIGDEHGGPGAHNKIPLSLAKFSLSSESGLIQRVFHDVIRLSHKSTRMFVSFMEIYNEKIRDLLVDHPVHRSGTSDTHSHSNGSTSGRIHAPTHVSPPADTLKLREHPTFGPYVENLVKIEVFSVADALRLVAKGQSARSSAQTIWNSNSSRSHAVVTLELSPTEIDPNKQFVDPRAKEVYENSYSPHTTPSKGSAQQREDGSGDLSPGPRDHDAPLLEQVVRIQMVDLAGSEKDTMRDEDENGVWAGARLDPTPSRSIDSLAEREKNELRLIRRSLSTLGYIIKALTKGASMRSLPYRDCTLTFLLKDALCGRNHTTMLATVSPSHTCYEETLSTLRYAERLCEVHTNRRAAAYADGGSIPLIAALEDGPGPRKVVLDEFKRIHQGLIQGSAANSESSREFIRKMLADTTPQRLRLHPHSTTPGSSLATAKFPMNGFTKALEEVTNEDLEELKNSYRKLASEVVEMQIDLDAVRTDRDTLTAELRTATDLLNEQEANQSDSKGQVAGLTKYLRASEKEIADLRALLKKRDENVERLLGELAEEKQARSSAEQAYQVRSKDFLARFDALKKENKVLSESLETVGGERKVTAGDKKDLAGQIERLKQQVKQLTQARDAADAEVIKLKADHAEVGKKFDAVHTKVEELEGVESQVGALTLQVEKMKSELSILTSERDSLVALLSQKDSMLQIQAQQAERNMRTLQLKHNALERSLALSAATSEVSIILPESLHADVDCQRLQDHLNELLASETAIVADAGEEESEGPAHAAASGSIKQKLAGVVRDMSSKLQDLEEAKFELAHERQMREALQRQLNEHTVSSQVNQVGKSALDHQVTRLQMELMKLQEAHKKLELDAGTAAEEHASKVDSLHDQIAALERELTTAKEELDLAKTRLSQQANTVNKSSSADTLKLQAENAALKDQLILCQRDAYEAKEELRTSKESMQAEYTSMWNSVQELSKLDALKDQSIEDLIADRDKAVLERDSAFERYAAAKAETNELLHEIRDVDFELLHAVEAGEYRLSPRGQNKSISIRNVSDRIMFGLARRQQQYHQHHNQLSMSMGSSGSGRFGGSLAATNLSHGSMSGTPPRQFLTTNSGALGFQSPPAAYHNSPNPAHASTPVITYNSSGQSQAQSREPAQLQQAQFLPPPPPLQQSVELERYPDNSARSDQTITTQQQQQQRYDNNSFMAANRNVDVAVQQQSMQRAWESNQQQQQELQLQRPVEYEPNKYGQGAPMVQSHQPQDYLQQQNMQHVPTGQSLDFKQQQQQPQMQQRQSALREPSPQPPHVDYQQASRRSPLDHSWENQMPQDQAMQRAPTAQSWDYMRQAPTPSPKPSVSPNNFERMEPAPYVSQQSNFYSTASKASIASGIATASHSRNWSNSGVNNKLNSNAQSSRNSDATLSEEEKLEQELQELALMEHKMRNKLHQTKSASTITSSASFVYGNDNVNASSSRAKKN